MNQRVHVLLLYEKIQLFDSMIDERSCHRNGKRENPWPREQWIVLGSITACGYRDNCCFWISPSLHGVCILSYARESLTYPTTCTAYRASVVLGREILFLTETPGIFLTGEPPSPPAARMVGT